ncbi:hypothetical protein ACH5RR_022803 [Cinchona calisaya]|uniref:ABC transporter domain-containing protein n=1 Tax=Cinchona calisaya TaxID=153742 RepID=A0ABD2Z8T2_9GENT
MPHNSPNSSPNLKWWPRDDTSIEEAFSSRPSSPIRYSAVSDGAITFTRQHKFETPRTSIQVPIFPGNSTPDVKQTIQNASPGTAKNMALKMCQSLKRHGLRDEIGKAFTRDEMENKEIRPDEAEEARRKSEELLGMEYLMRDGFVSYLRDVAKITPPIPQQVIRFSGISYSKKYETPSNEYETFGNKLVGCFITPFKKIFKKKNPTWINILKGVEGYIMPGSVTLLLGPPGCGKSTLLEILAGRAKGDENSHLEGVVMYNNRYASEVHLSRLIAYINDQLNKHIPFLTVRETLEFARDCSQTLRPENFTPQMRKFFAHALVEGQDPFLEYILEILNLKNIEHKLTGEAISDTDRQKLTTAELALGTYAVMLYDQPLSGSDLAATYDLVDTIRTISRIQQSSAIMSLSQLSQEVFDLFDRIILLGDGHIVFQGPRQDAVPYFNILGYEKPSHVESAEFLEDIAAGYGSQYIAPQVTPLSIDQLVEYFRNSDHYKDILRIATGDRVKHTYWINTEPGLGLSLKTPSTYSSVVDAKVKNLTELVVSKISSEVGHSGAIESTGRVQIGDVVTAMSINGEESTYIALGPQRILHEHASHAYSTLKKAEGHIRIQVERYEKKEENYHPQWEKSQIPFTQTWMKSTKTLIGRQIKITKRLQILLMLRLFQAIMLGVFTGTLFYKLGGQYDQQKMNSVRALGFVSTMSIMLINLVQLPLYMLQRPVFYKHRAQKFFRASSYVVAHCIVNIPQTLIEAAAYTFSMYFLVGLSLSGRGAALFQYLLLLFLVAYFGSSVFFFLSSISSIPEIGNALAGLLVSIFLLFSGFVIYPSNIPIYWKWLIYVNPIHWANISYCRLHFQYYVDQCSNYQAQLPFCDQFPSSTVGNAYLLYYELSKDTFRPWLPYAVLIGCTVAMNMLALWGLKTLEFTGINQSLPHLKRSAAVTNFRKDRESESLSSGSASDHLEELYPTIDNRPQNIQPTFVEETDKSGIERWIEDFCINIERKELGIPVEPVCLLFEDLSFKRFDKGTKKNISVFNRITGYANPRNMLALLGGSQESKSTLLKCLAGRIPSGPYLQGDLQANDVKPGPTFFRLIGYVEKLDAHQPYLSVRESLQFSAALRLNREIDTRSRRIHVELILNQLGLLPYSNQLVHSLRDATGRSFEIAKKMTIAVELAANPSILFLEEPIYGLNSTGILNILTIISGLSASGLNIIATLAHPTVRSLSVFDQALILTKEGEQAYFGPIGANCDDLLNYFSSIPSGPTKLTGESPISFVMGYLGQGIKSRGIPSLNFADSYRASSLHKLVNKEIAAIKNLHKVRVPEKIAPAYPAPYSRQAVLVLLSTQRFLWRNVQYTYGRLTGCIMIGFLMGSLYFQIEDTEVFGVTSRSLYIYMQVILIGVTSANNVIPQIGTDRLVYLREKRAGTYLPIFYPLSWALGEIPYFFIATLAMVGIGNGLAGIGTRSVSEFLIYWLVLFVFTLCVTYFGMMITFLAPLPMFAAFLVSILTSFWVSASGVVVLLSDIKFYHWMYWSDPFQYAINALTSISFYCNTKVCASNCSCPRLPDGSYVWDRLASLRALSYARIDTDILILAAMCVLFSSLAFLFFSTLRHNINLPV